MLQIRHEHRMFAISLQCLLGSRRCYKARSLNHSARTCRFEFLGAPDARRNRGDATSLLLAPSRLLWYAVGDLNQNVL